ncbi:MAG: peptide-methionine (S)-S-oxide reductase MsrA [Methanofollis sp.]|uniref:peptide-methionine (S)-S-oxide reductase MsrA n=1 Tax=Methanofollis sp. TaxID=2052835 RepID=UPI00260F23F0|nr:peptide-methionine (S)-S-oxide reductase MsrA [Methanofollis sp.]MDD4253832.1 peptide-methionine (S)-S-oxide reductase MsrA [Methanofollis sp.]
MAGEKHYERAYFAAGCFWGVEAAFRKVKGVVETAVGFMGGRTEDPTYEEVCTGRTGHAETVEVVFDPEEVGYADLLDVFWTIHDPTTKDRQGPDMGTQYRSAIFFVTPDQEREALASRERLEHSGKIPRPVVTGIVPRGPFFRAEEYHQRYYEKKGVGGCRIR